MTSVTSDAASRGARAFRFEQFALLSDPKNPTVHKSPTVASTCIWVPYHQHYFRRETPVLEGARALSLVAEMPTSSPMLRPMSTVATSRKNPAVTGHRTLGSLLTTQSILVTLCLRPFRTTGLYPSDLYDIPTVPLVFTNTMMYSCRTYRREYFTHFEADRILHKRPPPLSAVRTEYAYLYLNCTRSLLGVSAVRKDLD